jgi:hypothetical protein
VHRKEVWEAIKRENRAAAEVRPKNLSASPPPVGNGTRPKRSRTRRIKQTVDVGLA